MRLSLRKMPALYCSFSSKASGFMLSEYRQSLRLFTRYKFGVLLPLFVLQLSFFSRYSASAYGAGKISNPAMRLDGLPERIADSSKLAVPQQGSRIHPSSLERRAPDTSFAAQLARATAHDATGPGVKYAP